MSRMNPREVCANCRYWAEIPKHENDYRSPAEYVPCGECRVRSVERFPVRSAPQWCGEFSQAITTGRPSTEGGSHQPPDTKGWTENTIL